MKNNILFADKKDKLEIHHRRQGFHPADIVNTLRSNPNIKKIRLEYYGMYDDEFIQILDAIKVNQRITCLEVCIKNYDHWRLDNDGSYGFIQHEGVIYLASIIQHNTTMKKLALVQDTNGISVESAIALTKAIGNNISLEILELCVEGSRQINEVMQPFRNNFALKNLWINFYPGLSREDYLTASDLQSIAESLRLNCENSTLKELGLRANGISATALKVLCRYLELNSSLKYLDLCGNWFSDDGAKSLITLLSINATLTNINIDDCKLSNAYKHQIAQLLKFNQLLQSLETSTQMNDVLIAETKDMASSLFCFYTLDQTICNNLKTKYENIMHSIENKYSNNASLRLSLCL